MALSRDAYHMLEDIVGPENISEEPVILDSYAFQWSVELLRGGSKFMPRAEAVLLPATTEEVQAIIRTCNRHKIKFKAHSTAWITAAVPQTEGQIVLDLRRMDRILEIDEKNMFAVIEPYVIGATLQAEAMKRGLNTHMIGAGCASSPLASATSYNGPGPDSIFMGHSTENLLACEWVLPTGDILRTGSLGSGAGWFCGDGPGPSVRGAIRGTRGARGSLGVFTKCALKLSPWPGPDRLPVEGTIPAYYSPLPENIRAYTVAFPTWQAYTEAHYHIYDAEIGYIMHRQYNFLGGDLEAAFLRIFTDPTKSMDDLEEILRDPDIQRLTDEMRISSQIVLAGNTSRDIRYQEKALDAILAETGGWKVAAMSDPVMEKFTLLFLIRLGFKNLNMAYAGSYAGSFAQKGTPDFAMTYRNLAEELLAKHQKTGLIVDSGGDSMMGPGAGMGGGNDVSFEQFLFYDPSDIESIKGVGACFRDIIRAASESGLAKGGETERFPKAEQEKLWTRPPTQPSLLHWQRKIKEAFDPNDMGDSLYQTAPKQEEQGK